MPGYSTRNEKVTIGGQPYLLRMLSDKQQFSDPDGHGARLGISSAQWSLFGQLWPSGRLLAQAMCRFDIEGKRILELGCASGWPASCCCGEAATWSPPTSTRWPSHSWPTTPR